jgi:hypothetical protein
MEIRWCIQQNKKCDYCTLNMKKKCNYEEREGASYLDCQYAIIPKAEFKVICEFCSSNDVDIEVWHYAIDNYNEIKYTCNNCGNHN